MNEAEAMLHKQQKRIEALEAELARAGKPVIKPIPCGKFRGAPTPEWVAKLMEETNEVVQEATMAKACDYVVDDSDLAEELTDVITVCVSWLDTLGYDEVARERLQERVNEKNREREYHDEADS